MRPEKVEGDPSLEEQRQLGILKGFSDEEDDELREPDSDESDYEGKREKYEE